MRQHEGEKQSPPNREAGRPICEADRQAKKELKKKVRDVPTIERAMAGPTNAEANVVMGYCSAVRSALTDDGPPPLEASGRKLHVRPDATVGSRGRTEAEGGCRSDCNA